MIRNYVISYCIKISALIQSYQSLRLGWELVYDCAIIIKHSLLITINIIGCFPTIVFNFFLLKKGLRLVSEIQLIVTCF